MSKLLKLKGDDLQTVFDVLDLTCQHLNGYLETQLLKIFDQKTTVFELKLDELTEVSSKFQFELCKLLTMNYCSQVYLMTQSSLKQDKLDKASELKK